MNAHERFELECASEISKIGKNVAIAKLATEWMQSANQLRYSYHFKHMGRPIIQYPQDIVAIQALIWEVKPDLIVETGIAHGGSLVMSASMLALLDMCEAIE